MSAKNKKTLVFLSFCLTLIIYTWIIATIPDYLFPHAPLWVNTSYYGFFGIAWIFIGIKFFVVITAIEKKERDGL
jgi:hypothetical protein